MNIAIAGFGVEGQSSYKYWQCVPDSNITIVNETDIPAAVLPEGVATITGEGAFGRLNGFDLVIRSAGVAPHKIVTDGKVWSGTNEFFYQCSDQSTTTPNVDTIGVTGSKGKGTTSSLIASILEAAGRKVWLVGNIGVAALDVINQIQPGDVVVYELSSFQLWDIERSPQTSVVLFIEQEHLDVHKDMAEYVAAKGNIARFQTPEDILIYNAKNEYSRSIAEASAAQKVGYPSTATTHVREGFFYNGEQKLCSVDALQLPGEHNISNAIAAIDAVWKYTQDASVIYAGLSTFKGLPHRLSFVETVKGVDYYDDSIATTPASAIAALRAFDKPKVIILGGSSKGSDFSELAHELTLHDAQAVLIGDEAVTIAKALDAVGFTKYVVIEDATATSFTETAAALAAPGSVVLLSPAAASFGLFKNYVDRGEQYIAAVHELTY